MISAKDEFFIEREMLHELRGLMYKSDLSHEEREAIEEGITGGLTSEVYDQIITDLYQRQKIDNPVVRIKNGETLSAKEINQAVMKVVNDE